MKKTIISLALMASAGLACAQQSPIYFGISGGQVKYDAKTSVSQVEEAASMFGVTNLSFNVDDKDVAYKAFAGYQANKYWAFETGYANLGKAKLSSTGLLGANSVKLDQQASVKSFFVDAVGSLPFSKEFQIFGKAGLAYTMTKSELSFLGSGVSLVGKGKANEIVPMFGAGAEYKISKHVSVRGEFERFLKVGDPMQTGESDIDLMSFGLRFNF